MSTAAFTLYGWQLSYFTGKVRSYLQYKQIPFVEKPVDLPTLTVRIKQKTGAVVMPVLVTPEGDWMQDSSVIIDRMEERFSARPVLPVSPVQRFVSSVLEAWGDEWWIPVAMHTRWSYPENAALFEREAGDALLPWAPAFLQRRLAHIPMRAMRGHLVNVGVVPAQFKVMDAWTHAMLDKLDAHFAQVPFLLGQRPSLGDFSLAGPLYAHLGRDPWPKRELIAPRRHLQAWINRMSSKNKSHSGELAPTDAIPPTLTPVLRSVFREFLPMLEGTLTQLRSAQPALAPGRAFPRGLGEIAFPMGEGTFKRAALPYSLWMAQRSLDIFRRMTPAEQTDVRAWLQSQGGERWLDLDIPRLRRVGLQVAPEVST